MGIASTKLIPASRNLLTRRKLFGTPCMVGKLRELSLHQMINIWEIQAMSNSSIYNIVPDNRKQLHLGKFTLEIGQTVRHQHGRGGAGEFGDTPGEATDSESEGEEDVAGIGSADVSNGSATINGDYTSSDGSENADVSEIGVKYKRVKDVKDIDNVGIRKQSLQLYVVNVQHELNHMRKQINFGRQQTNLLVNSFRNDSKNIDVILGYLARVQMKAARIEVTIGFLKREPVVSIEDSLYVIDKHLQSMDVDLIWIHEKIDYFQPNVMVNPEHSSNLNELRKTVNLIQYIVSRIRGCKAYIQK